MSLSKLNCIKEAFTKVFVNEGLCDLKVNGFLFNCLGSIPGVGLATGIIRLMNIPKCNDHFSLKDDRFHNNWLKVFCIVRAVLEMVGLGIICLLIDIILTLALCLVDCVSDRKYKPVIV